MTRPVSALRNLGPRSVEAFAKAGIHSAEQLIALGPNAAYARLLGTGVRPNFAMFWALTFAIQDRHWTDLGSEEKAALRARFDAVKAAAAPVPGGQVALEAALDRFGVGQPTSSRPEKK